MRAVIAAVVVVGVLLLAFFSAWAFPGLLMLLVFSALGVAGIVWWTASSGRHVNFGVTKEQLRDCVGRIAITFALIAPIPWGAGFDAIEPAPFLGVIVVGLAGTFLAARRLPMDWAIVTAPVMLIACVWVAMLSLYIAYEVGWQDLSWSTAVDEPGDIGSPEVQLALLLFFGTIAAPIPGLIVGFFSQGYKKEAAAEGSR